MYSAMSEMFKVLNKLKQRIRKVRPSRKFNLVLLDNGQFVEK